MGFFAVSLVLFFNDLDGNPHSQIEFKLSCYKIQLFF